MDEQQLGKQHRNEGSAFCDRLNTQLADEHFAWLIAECADVPAGLLNLKIETHLHLAMPLE